VSAGRSQAAGVAAALLLGVLQLPAPFTGDLSLFALGGARLLDGAVLYRDFWDVKQPGVFGFYAGARAAFGADEAAVRALELVWMAALAAAIAAATRKRLRSSVALALAPLWGVGLLYAAAKPWHLGQVEALAGLPLFLAAWLAAPAPAARAAATAGRPPERASAPPPGDVEAVAWPGPARLAAAGAAGAAAVLLKLFFLPILLAVWLPALVRRPAAFRAAAALAAGFLAPLAAVLLAFAGADALDEAAWTTFVAPARVAAKTSARALLRIGESALWFGLFYGPAAVLAVAGARAAVRRRDVLGIQLIAWLAAGALVFLAQAGSWWTYQVQLLGVPCAVLGAWGLDELLERLRGLPAGRARRSATMLLAAFLALGSAPALVKTARRVALLARNDWALSESGLAAYRDAVGPGYAQSRREVAFLKEPGALTGPIVVIGDPTQIHLARRAQAVSIHGWVPWRLLPEQWRRMAREVAAVRPPYVLVEHEFRAMLVRRAPELRRVLDTLYVPLRTTSGGTWYVRRDSTSPPSAAWRRIPAA
jgi:hypothetical protein